MKVYVLTNPELGWDCVMGVFSSIKALHNFYFEDNLSKYPYINDDETRNILRKDSCSIFEEQIKE